MPKKYALQNDEKSNKTLFYLLTKLSLQGKRICWWTQRSLNGKVDMLVYKLYGVREEVIAFVVDDEMCVEKINFCNKILKI